MKPTSSMTWYKWTQFLAGKHAEDCRHNVARADALLIQELCNSLRELHGFIRPYRGIEFADGSGFPIDAVLVPKIKAEFARQRALRDSARVRQAASSLPQVPAICQEKVAA